MAGRNTELPTSVGHDITHVLDSPNTTDRPIFCITRRESLNHSLGLGNWFWYRMGRASSALERRAREGGSYLVRVSLAQTGRWLTGLGRVPADEIASAPEDLTADQIEALSTTSDGPFGRLRHLAPIVQMSETRARWERPAVPLDHHEPVWPD